MAPHRRPSASAAPADATSSEFCEDDIGARDSAAQQDCRVTAHDHQPSTIVSAAPKLRRSSLHVTDAGFADVVASVRYSGGVPPPSMRRSPASSAWHNHLHHSSPPIQAAEPPIEKGARGSGLPESNVTNSAWKGGTWYDGEPAPDAKRKIRSYVQKVLSSHPADPRRSDSRFSAGKDRCLECLALFYQKAIVQGLLRRRPLPPSSDGRHIPLPSMRPGLARLIDERRNRPYVSNSIRSSRYTIYDFVPRQLVFQFSILGNFYLLVFGIMQMIPGLSAVGQYTTIGPLSVFIAFSMAKEGVDDHRRYKLGKAENRSSAFVLARNDGDRSQGGLVAAARGRAAATSLGESRDWTRVQWQHVRVGDVRLRRDQSVPADMVLHATGPNGIAYVDTMALDSETHLKSKQACPLLADRCATVDDIRSLRATVVSEDPNLDLYSYEGRLTVDGQTLPLSLGNVLYRGSTLRNTTEAIGLVVNTGEECKIRMNANKHVRAKAPVMQSIINRMVLLQIVLVIALSAGLSGAYFIWKSDVEVRSFYLVPPGVRNQGTSKNLFFGFLIMFHNLIPLSMYINMEIIKGGQLFLMRDAEMYDAKTDTPMVANTSTILENLGQVNYISDKTGTLTENMMRFRKLTVAGVACLHDREAPRADNAADFKQWKRECSQRRSRAERKPSPNVAVVPTVFVQEPDEDTHDGREEGTRPPTAPLIVPTGLATTCRTDSFGPGYPTEITTDEMLNYLAREPQTPFSRKAKQLLLCIALCHTCLPEVAEDGEIAFQAASPDEVALVEAARDLGILLIDRPAQAIQLQTRDADGSLHVGTYHVLDVVEFSSKRKRMSIIRMPDGRICLFCKGAESTIQSRLRLSDLAQQTAEDIGHRASLRKSLAQDLAMRRVSEQTARSSFGLLSLDSSDWVEGLRLSIGRRVTDARRPSHPRDMDEVLSQQAQEEFTSPRFPVHVTRKHARLSATSTPTSFDRAAARTHVDEAVAADEAVVFERCFQHIDDFASEGLRTLLFAYRYLDEDTYASWKARYRAAETSLDRQERAEEVGEQIEWELELAGATAIEDKLQEGVRETIDKLRRVKMKMWMLTGDKRETAINIGHSAGLCLPSELYVLDGPPAVLHATMAAALRDVDRGCVPHSVLVIGGQTLAAIEADDALAVLFLDLAVRVDAVICCRATPSQKATLVRAIRRGVADSMTLAIGDGANDIGMIQASNVGVGISGREGLQAARIADYSIAQFRFLQRLLLVHGRWNYLRTRRYVLATFWKEVLFFLIQAHFQRSVGYSGTSLFEPWSLTLFNGIFTSMPVLFLGVLECDLSAATLLAVPELYATYGPRQAGFNLRLYFGWMTVAVAGSFIIFHTTRAVYHHALFTDDTTLFAMGNVCFTLAVLFINFKLLFLEMYYKTIIVFVSFTLSIAGWFFWNVLLSYLYPPGKSAYIVRSGFLHAFGRQPIWWVALLLGFACLLVLDLVVQSIRRVYFPTDLDLVQRIEQDRKRAAATESSSLPFASRPACRDVEMSR